MLAICSFCLEEQAVSSVLKDAQTWLGLIEALLWPSYTSRLWFGSVEEQGKSPHEPAYFGWMETSVTWAGC